LLRYITDKHSFCSYEDAEMHPNLDFREEVYN